MIDKAGKWGGNTAAAKDLSEIYKNNSDNASKFAKYGTLFWGSLAIINTALIQFGAKSPYIIIPLGYVAISQGTNLWRRYAARKLDKGLWTVRTTPPPVGNKETVKIPAGAQPEGL